MFDARYIQRGDAIDYTPDKDIEAGEVVFVGPLCGIAKLPVQAGVIGALAIHGVFEFTKGSDAIAAGTALYWDKSGKAATATANDSYIGVAIADAPAASGVVRVVINEAIKG